MRLEVHEHQRGEFDRLSAEAFETKARAALEQLVVRFREGGALEKSRAPFPRDGSVAALDELSEMLDRAYEERLGLMARAAVEAVRASGGIAKGAHRVPSSSHPVELGPPPARARKRFPHQGTIDFQGLRILVENRAGSYRTGTDGDGHRWRVKMLAHYGEIAGTEGTDGDRLDAYVGPNADSPLVVVVHQQHPETKAFDEDKVMLGFDTVEAALALYRAQYDRPGFYGGHEAMPIGRLLRWARDPANRGQRVRKAGGFRALVEAFVEVQRSRVGT